jgi:hypothetical protein
VLVLVVVLALEKLSSPILVLDGGMDCEKTGDPTKQVERRGTHQIRSHCSLCALTTSTRTEPLVADFGVSSVERYAALCSLRLCGDSSSPFAVAELDPVLLGSSVPSGFAFQSDLHYAGCQRR